MDRCGLLGRSHRRSASGFRPGRSVPIHHRSPQFDPRVHPLSDALPLRSTTPADPLRCLDERAFQPARPERLPWGFAPHHDVRRQQPLPARDNPGYPVSALRCVLGVPPAHDALLRCRPCGFVSPRSRVQGSPFRGLDPPYGAVPPFDGRCPRDVDHPAPAVARASTERLAFRALLSARSATIDRKR